MAKSGRLELADDIYGHYKLLWRIGPAKQSNSVKKKQNKGYYAVRGHRGRYQSKLCSKRNFVADFLQAKCNFRGKKAVLRFWAPLWGSYGQRTMIILGSLESA